MPPNCTATPGGCWWAATSAGGTLSAVVAQMAREKGAPRLAGQVLFYPATNSAALDTPSYKEFGEKSLGLPKRDMEWFLDQYTPDPSDRLDPLRLAPVGKRPARIAARPGGDRRVRRAAR